MNFLKIEQNSPEWWDYKVGKISGTRFGQLISNRENTLIEKLANEKMDGFIEVNEYVNEDMQFGIDNEPIAGEKTAALLGVKLIAGGVIQSDFHEDHMSSPDFHFINERGKITVIEVKCTQSGEKHLSRFRKGFESDKMPQIYNYFAGSDDIDEVIHVSYCPFRPERELVLKCYYLTDKAKIGTNVMTIKEVVDYGRSLLEPTFDEVNELINKFQF